MWTLVSSVRAREEGATINRFLRCRVVQLLSFLEGLWWVDLTSKSENSTKFVFLAKVKYYMKGYTFLYDSLNWRHIRNAFFWLSQCPHQSHWLHPQSHIKVKPAVTVEPMLSLQCSFASLIPGYRYLPTTTPYQQATPTMMSYQKPHPPVPRLSQRSSS